MALKEFYGLFQLATIAIILLSRAATVNRL